MTNLKQQGIIVIVSVIGTIAILVTAFVAKGSKYEDAWFYVTALMIVLLPALDLYFKKRNKRQ